MVGNSSLPIPPWQLKFDAATRESDPDKLAKLLTEAEDAIFVRLSYLPHPGTRALSLTWQTT